MFGIGNAFQTNKAHVPDNAPCKTECVVYLVCTASAYVRASGSLYEACLKMARREHGEELASVIVNMTLVDNSQEETVLVLSENICNIANEFSDLHDLAAVQSNGIPAVLTTAICASKIVGAYDSDPDTACCNILLMVSDQAELLKDLVEDVIVSATKDDLRWEIFSVRECAIDDPSAEDVCIIE
ncbi:hypothetical protein CYMTET_3906 [Cymbomonas tetramitiformis]|uniref:Uncharacterized protein n=1 Tax=Cymbomonas tetramitiformis TaxID=36881 RepID=A0AAE0H2I2_9CHLO|nr:hypothetical protein CYMTET_7889 [Cymbomonas tetramitiformis]KAK3288688.1 hypothetical protein CYMTET_3906 [Cymbomonas tetramitiformis]